MTGFKDENGHRIEPQPDHLAELNQRRENIARLLSENTKLREQNAELFKNWFKAVTEHQ